MRFKETAVKIQILGAGCPKCRILEETVRRVVEKENLSAEVEKITDIETIMDMGVMITPALAIDGEVKSSGKVLNEDQVKAFLVNGE
jgi:small redox-active disulfide protein 2